MKDYTIVEGGLTFGEKNTRPKKPKEPVAEKLLSADEQLEEYGFTFEEPSSYIDLMDVDFRELDELEATPPDDSTPLTVKNISEHHADVKSTLLVPEEYEMSDDDVQAALQSVKDIFSSEQFKSLFKPPNVKNDFFYLGSPVVTFEYKDGHISASNSDNYAAYALMELIDLGKGIGFNLEHFGRIVGIPYSVSPWKYTIDCNNIDENTHALFLKIQSIFRQKLVDSANSVNSNPFLTMEHYPVLDFDLSVKIGPTTPGIVNINSNGIYFVGDIARSMRMLSRVSKPLNYGHEVAISKIKEYNGTCQYLNYLKSKIY